MANIKKTFNFRNGVQVDDDNLIVNATGLVGIGTTIPTEALDVRGTTKVVGLVTSQEGFVGVFTAHTSSLGTVALSTSIIGAGVSIKSGIITSNAASGLVTYYGDARFLQGMPTSQWEDTNTGLGVSSIYNTGGTVGVGTTNPQFTLQVGSNANGGEHGVGISSAGNIKASGIITATGLDINGNGDVSGNLTVGAGITGDVTGRITGDVVGNINSGVSTITTLNATNVNIAGLSTHRVAFTNASDNLTDSEDLTFNDSTNTLNVVGTTDTDQLNVSGVTTFRDDVQFLGVAVTSPVPMLWDKSAGHLKFKQDNGIRLGNLGQFEIVQDAQYSRMISTATQFIISSNILRFVKQGTTETLADFTSDGAASLRYDDVERFTTTGVGVTVYNQLDTTNIVASGVITATTELNSPLVGVGTDDPATDIQVRKAGGAQIRVTSDTDAAIVSVGRVSGASNGANAALRYGNNSAGFPYSNSNALDIINYDIGNVNFYLSAANAGNAQGGFIWHKGSNNNRLMTLTNVGRLGIGVTLPTENLHVGGGITCTNTSWFGSHVNVTGNLGVSGNINLTGNLNVPAGLSGELWEGNVLTNASVGIVTTKYLNVTGVSTISDAISINNSSNIGSGDNRLIINSGAQQFWVTNSGRVGVATNIINNGIEFEVSGDGVFSQSVSVGTTQFKCAVDFADAVSANGANRDKIAYMVPPRVNNTQRNALTNVSGASTETGAIIYNTTTNKHQGYNGTSWNDLY